METRLEEASLIVSGIDLFGFHGVTKEERVGGNRYQIDLKIEGEFKTALDTDRLEDSIDYSQVVKVVSEINRARRYSLIESFADAIASGLLKRFSKIKKITVRVAKLDPPGLEEKVACAAIELTKERV